MAVAVGSGGIGTAPFFLQARKARGVAAMCEDHSMDEAKSSVAAGRIGPNAITRVAEALEVEVGAAKTAAVFAVARLSHHLDQPPGGMVDECDVTALHRALRAELAMASVRRVSRTAGRLTGAYLLAHRIPRPAQWLLRALPGGPSARALLAAIRRHAWTFSGTGVFTAEAGRPVRLAIAGCPICAGARSDQPVCDYYAATFECLFQTLVHPRCTVVETDCQAMGANACRFEIEW